MRLPSGNDRLEMAAREAAAKRFKRGSLNFNLALNRSDADSAASSMQVPISWSVTVRTWFAAWNGIRAG